MRNEFICFVIVEADITTTTTTQTEICIMDGAQ
jgi:hypothetical protein